MVTELVGPASRAPTAEDLGFVALVTGAPWVAGRLLHSRGRRAAEAGRRALADERARIARELHDVVAHGVTLMVIQAVGAQRRLRDDPEAAERAMQAVEATGRESLAELRRLLGLLRPDGEPQVEPQPGLADLEQTAERARAGGLQVDLRREGEIRALPPGLDLAAYRIVQEGLTNAARHGQAAEVRVVVRYGARDVQLEVSSAAGARAASELSTDGGRRGLVGVRERAALYGGRVEAGATGDGGFCVRAVLPIGADGR